MVDSASFDYDQVLQAVNEEIAEMMDVLAVMVEVMSSSNFELVNENEIQLLITNFECNKTKIFHI